MENGGVRRGPAHRGGAVLGLPVLPPLSDDLGRLQVAFVQTRLGKVPKDHATQVQRVLYGALPAVRLSSPDATDREEARALFHAWEEIGPLLAYAPVDGEWEAVVTMQDLLQDLYADTPPHADTPARAYRLHCCKAAYQSNYLFYLPEDVTSAGANAAALGVGLRSVCADVVESLNAIVKGA